MYMSLVFLSHPCNHHREILCLCMYQIETLDAMAVKYEILMAQVASNNATLAGLSQQVAQTEGAVSQQVAGVRTELMAQIAEVSKMPGPPVSVCVWGQGVKFR